jgi:hypothetical protein
MNKSLEITNTRKMFKNESAEEDYFAPAFENGPLKTSVIVLSILYLFFIIPSGLGIIWYERFGSDLKRNLINRLLTSVCWTGLIFYAIVQPIETARYIFGPLPKSLCLFHLMYKNVLNLQTILFFDGVTVAHYFYVFGLKDPTRFKDDFWHFLVTVWVLSFGFLSQFVFVFLPGHQPISFYLCSGTDPRSNGTDIIVKKNHIFNILVLASLIIQVAVAIRFVIHRLKIDASTSTASHSDSFRKEIIYDVLFCLMIIVWGLIYGYLVFTLNFMDPILVNKFPNYLLIYGLHLGFPMILSSTFSIFFYSKNKQLRATIFEKICENFKLEEVVS